MSKKEKPTTPEPFKPNPHFADTVNRNIIESEIEGGVYLKDLEVGSFLEVETKNRIYTIEKRKDGFYMSGHPEFCPEPTKVEIPGSTWGGSMLKTGFIGRGMHLEYVVPGKKPVTTTQIREIKEFTIISN